jgi:hypothetical protein
VCRPAAWHVAAWRYEAISGWGEVVLSALTNHLDPQRTRVLGAVQYDFEPGRNMSTYQVGWKLLCKVNTKLA